jgi:hypothetical protein
MSAKDGIELDRVVFIGRMYFEYVRMFDLDVVRAPERSRS